MIVISACYRNFDLPKRAPSGIDAFMFTDQPEAYPGWSLAQARANSTLSGRYSNKAPKCAPHLFGFDGPDVIWLDASMHWTGTDLGSLLSQVPPGGVGIYRHRERNCLYDEANFSHDRHGYQPEPILSQAAHYKRMGHPEKTGLWETGIIVWRGAQRLVGAAWLAEMLAWTCQDQISLPYVVRNANVTITDLAPGTVVHNPWFHYVPHRVTFASRPPAKGRKNPRPPVRFR